MSRIRSSKSAAVRKHLPTVSAQGLELPCAPSGRPHGNFDQAIIADVAKPSGCRTLQKVPRHRPISSDRRSLRGRWAYHRLNEGSKYVSDVPAHAAKVEGSFLGHPRGDLERRPNNRTPGKKLRQRSPQRPRQELVLIRWASGVNTGSAAATMVGIAAREQIWSGDQTIARPARNCGAKLTPTKPAAPATRTCFDRWAQE